MTSPHLDRVNQNVSIVQRFANIFCLHDGARIIAIRNNNNSFPKVGKILSIVSEHLPSRIERIVNSRVTIS